MRPGRGGGGVSVRLVAGLWRTPIPYIFLGLAFMMGVIAMALLVLVCTRKKALSSSSSSRRDQADEQAAARAVAPLDREPKVVVFMPGDHAPSCLASAKPLGGDGAATAV